MFGPAPPLGAGEVDPDPWFGIPIREGEAPSPAHMRHLDLLRANTRDRHLAHERALMAEQEHWGVMGGDSLGGLCSIPLLSSSCTSCFWRGGWGCAPCMFSALCASCPQ
eukprot:12457590-Alexandrium_andersonii.AAC.1